MKIIDYSYLCISQTYISKRSDLYLKNSWFYSIMTEAWWDLTSCHPHPSNNCSVLNCDVKYCIYIIAFNIYSNYKEISKHVYCITVMSNISLLLIFNYKETSTCLIIYCIFVNLQQRWQPSFFGPNIVLVENGKLRSSVKHHIYYLG
jgi:hypothetical protein